MIPTRHPSSNQNENASKMSMTTSFVTTLPPNLLRQQRNQNTPLPPKQQQQHISNLRNEALERAKKEKIPVRRIFEKQDMDVFYKSKAFIYYNHFVNELNDAIKSKSLSITDVEISPVVDTAIKILNDKLLVWIDQYPCIEQRSLSRFGNIAFRSWFDKVVEESENLMKLILNSGVENNAEKTLNDIDEWKVKELASYFVESFGNRTRIDYGTGHEAAFCAWMCCLARLELVGKKDALALVARLFPAYLNLMRKIQIYYKLEPAGSHGVWGLDDYQFLPYIWGSSQLIDHPNLKPKDIQNKNIVDMYANDNLYFASIKFINDVKKGPFAEHSPMLNDISSVPLWSKVNSGLLRMYQDEVMKKFVVIQHFLFGKLLPFEDTDDPIMMMMTTTKKIDSSPKTPSSPTTKKITQPPSSSLPSSSIPLSSSSSSIPLSSSPLNVNSKVDDNVQ